MSVSISGSQITFSDGSTQNTAPNGSFKNRIINGAMMIDQRNAGASVTGNDAVFGVDRWKAIVSQSSKFTMQQNAGSVTPPSGFTNYLGCTSSSAYTVGSAETFNIAQFIEGFNTSDLDWGTANAKAVTLSFWVRSSLTGTFSGSLSNSAVSRSYPFNYTISSANTWEQKSVTIAGDTSGTWVTNNGIGIRLYFSLGTGSTLVTTAGSWASGFYLGATGTTSVVGTNGATFYITGVQLEKGSTATSFDYRPYGTELQLCQRYYTKFVTDGDIYTFWGSGGVNSSTNAIISGQFPTKMRSSPTISVSNARIYDCYSAYSTTTIGTNRSSTTSLSAEFTISGATQGRPAFIGANNNTAGYMDASAEL